MPVQPLHYGLEPAMHGGTDGGVPSGLAVVDLVDTSALVTDAPVAQVPDLRGAKPSLQGARRVVDLVLDRPEQLAAEVHVAAAAGRDPLGSRPADPLNVDVAERHDDAT